MSQWISVSSKPSHKGKYKVVINERGKESISTALWNGKKWSKQNIEMWKEDTVIENDEPFTESYIYKKYLKMRSQLDPPDGKL